MMNNNGKNMAIATGLLISLTGLLLSVSECFIKGIIITVLLIVGFTYPLLRGD